MYYLVVWAIEFQPCHNIHPGSPISYVTSLCRYCILPAVAHPGHPSDTLELEQALRCRDAVLHTCPEQGSRFKKGRNPIYKPEFSKIRFPPCFEVLTILLSISMQNGSRCIDHLFLTFFKILIIAQDRCGLHWPGRHLCRTGVHLISTWLFDQNTYWTHLLS